MTKKVLIAFPMRSLPSQSLLFGLYVAFKPAPIELSIKGGVEKQGEGKASAKHIIFVLSNSLHFRRGFVSTFTK